MGRDTRRNKHAGPSPISRAGNRSGAQATTEAKASAQGEGQALAQLSLLSAENTGPVTIDEHGFQAKFAYEMNGRKHYEVIAPPEYREDLRRFRQHIGKLSPPIVDSAKGALEMAASQRREAQEMRDYLEDELEALRSLESDRESFAGLWIHRINDGHSDGYLISAGEREQDEGRAAFFNSLELPVPCAWAETPEQALEAALEMQDIWDAAREGQLVVIPGGGAGGERVEAVFRDGRWISEPALWTEGHPESDVVNLKAPSRPAPQDPYEKRLRAARQVKRRYLEVSDEEIAGYRGLPKLRRVPLPAT